MGAAPTAFTLPFFFFGLGTFACTAPVFPLVSFSSPAVVSACLCLLGQTMAFSGIVGAACPGVVLLLGMEPSGSFGSSGSEQSESGVSARGSRARIIE